MPTTSYDQFTEIVKEQSGYFPFFYGMIQSHAYLVLTPIERCVLIDLWSKVHPDVTRTKNADVINAEFGYTYSDCYLPISITSFYSAMKSLERVGFIDKVDSPAHSVVVARRNKYKLSIRRKDYVMTDVEKADYQEFMKTKKTVLQRNLTNVKKRVPANVAKMLLDLAAENDRLRQVNEDLLKSNINVNEKAETFLNTISAPVTL